MSWSQKGGHKHPSHKRPGHKRPGDKRPATNPNKAWADMQACSGGVIIKSKRKTNFTPML